MPACSPPKVVPSLEDETPRPVDVAHQDRQENQNFSQAGSGKISSSIPKISQA